MLELFVTNTVARILILAIIFAVVVAVVIFVVRLAARRAEIRSSVAAIAQTKAIAATSHLRERKDTGWSAVVERVEQAGLSLSDTNADRLRDKMCLAGYTHPAAPKLFTLSRLVLVVLLPAIYFILTSLDGEERSLTSLYMVGGGLAVLGLYLPNLFVTAKADRRQEEIRNGFPDCLDLMLVCVEAGLGLEAALDRVGRELVKSHPLVSMILSIATLQLRAGAQREDALRKMAENSGVEEIRSFATLLIQSDKLGTSISETLRVYAAEMREKRRMRAEEKAHRLPVLISIPLVVCMLPTMIGVLMLPGIVRVIRQLIPALAGGG